MSTSRATFAMRRAELVARAAADRETLAHQLAPLRRLHRGIERVGQVKAQLPALAVGAGLGLSALLLALPTGRFPLVRGGIALLQVAGSLRRVVSRR